jgi:hypothetical protein
LKEEISTQHETCTAELVAMLKRLCLKQVQIQTMAAFPNTLLLISLSSMVQLLWDMDNPTVSYIYLLSIYKVNI